MEPQNAILTPSFSRSLQLDGKITMDHLTSYYYQIWPLIDEYFLFVESEYTYVFSGRFVHLAKLDVQNLKVKFVDTKVFNCRIEQVIKDVVDPWRFLLYGDFDRIVGFKFIEIKNDQLVPGEEYQKVVEHSFNWGFVLEGEFCRKPISYPTF